MKYVRIRLDFKSARKGRFTRTVLVRDNPDLEDLGKYLVFALGGELEHMYLFKDKYNSYLPSEWLEDGEEEGKSLEESYLSKIVHIGTIYPINFIVFWIFVLFIYLFSFFISNCIR